MKYILLVLLTFFVLFSCTTGRDIGRGAVTYKSSGNIHIEIDRTGKVLISSPLMPGTYIYADTTRKDKDGITFSITSISMITNWPGGWTHAVYEASGLYSLNPDEDGYSVIIIEPLLLWEISKGEIRYFDTYYRESDGLHKTRQRVDRIRETVRFLKEDRNYPPLSGHLKKNTSHGPGFSRLQGAFLFPEFFDRRNQTVRYWKRGVAWDENYTEEHMPEILRKLRNSGSLWRDFEEAPQMYLSLYNLDYIFDTYIGTINFQRRGK